jgi:hypothetical protein
MVKGHTAVVLCAGLLVFASSALAASDPLRPGPDAPPSKARTDTPTGLATGLVQQVDPSTLTGTHFVTFQDVSAGSQPGTNYDGVVTSGNVDFAERFLGQTLSYNGNFDVLSGVGSAPLTPQVGAPNQNVAIYTDIFANNIIAGLGPLGYPNLDAIGEGALAMLFPLRISEVGFDVFGIDGGGSLTINFFRADGSRIDTITLPTVMSPDIVRLAFQRVDSIDDIAGITIENDDPAGLGYGNIQFGAALLHPTPALSYVALGLVGAVLTLIAAARLRANGSSGGDTRN